MNYPTCAIGLTLCLGLAFGSVRLPAAAHDDAMTASIDCSKASSLMSAQSASSAMEPGASVDQSFAHMMMAQSKAAMAMAHIEMACGKDAKTRKFAQQSLEKLRQELDEARLLVGAAG